MADKRLTPARPDLAAAFLKGQVEAARFVEGVEACVAVGRAALRAAQSDDAAQDSELLHGERVSVYERKDGWAWVQAANDRYVGYVQEGALGPVFAADLRVAVPAAPVFAAADLKKPVRDLLPLNAMVAALAREGDYVAIAPGAFVHHRHLAAPDAVEKDFVSVAERFLGVPYVWGGKSFAGLDCSGLVQTALAAAGTSAPRDSDMQAALGMAVAGNDYRRGDLVFWKGHVGVMQDGARLLHANAFHMQVASEPLDQALARMGAPIAIRRL